MTNVDLNHQPKLLESEIFPFYETFEKGYERNKIKAQLSIKLGYDAINVHKKLEGKTGRCLSEIEIEGIIRFFQSEYPEKISEFLQKSK